mmetsp:Transcript_15423/g.31656  ORF Transcript_15423/g.31656 Transcript_15423/m.31656 type:complete len:191 (+) Transcript_15423:785-1357(+)
MTFMETAKAQLQQQQQQQQQNQPPTSRTVHGPVFVSIGSADQLKVFLEKNPAIPRDRILVDDYDHKSYKETMGFERFDEIKSIRQLRGLDVSKLVVPLVGVLGIRKLLEYVTNVPFLAPLEGDLNWRDLPEGGLRNGGTIVLGVDGSSSSNDEVEVLYRWNDKIPGDVPDPRAVYQAAKDARVETNEVKK